MSLTVDGLTVVKSDCAGTPLTVGVSQAVNVAFLGMFANFYLSSYGKGGEERKGARRAAGSVVPGLECLACCAICCMHPLPEQLVAGLTCVTSMFGIWYLVFGIWYLVFCICGSVTVVVRAAGRRAEVKTDKVA